MTEVILPAAPLPNAGARTITTPFQFLVTGEDNLRVRVWSAVAADSLIVSGRFVDTSGAIQVFNQQIACQATRLVATQMIPLSPGYVLSIAAQVTNSNIRRGAIFVSIDLVRGLGPAQTTLGTLIQGYVGTFDGIAYPGSPIESPIDGRGWLKSVSGNQPAAGANWTLSVPTGARWRVLSLTATLQTDGTVGTRLPFVFASPLFGNVEIVLPTQGSQAAGQLLSYMWACGMPTLAAAFSGWWSQSFPDPMYLASGDRIQSSTAGLAAGDQWQNIGAVVEEWIDIWS